MGNFFDSVGENMQNFWAKAREEQKANEQWKNENRNDIIYNDFKNNLDKKRLRGEISASDYDKRLADLPNFISMWCPEFDKEAWQAAQEQTQREQEEVKQLLARRDAGCNMASIDKACEQLNGTGSYMIIGNINNSQANIIGDPQAVAALGGNVAFTGLTADQIAASNLSEKDKTALYGKQQGILGVVNINSLRQNFTATASNGVQAGMSGLQNAVAGGTNYSDFVQAQMIANGNYNNNYIIATGANEAVYYPTNNSGCNASYMAIPCGFQPCHGPNVGYCPCQMSTGDMLYAGGSANFQQGYNIYQQQQQSQLQNGFQQKPNLPAWALQNNQSQNTGHNHSHGNCRSNNYSGTRRLPTNGYSGDNDSGGGFDNC